MTDDATQLLAWLQIYTAKHGPPSRRTLQQRATPSRLRKPDVLTASLEALEAEGRITLSREGGGVVVRPEGSPATRGPEAGEPEPEEPGPQPMHATAPPRITTAPQALELRLSAAREAVREIRRLHSIAIGRYHYHGPPKLAHRLEGSQAMSLFTQALEALETETAEIQGPARDGEDDANPPTPKDELLSRLASMDVERARILDTMT